MRPVLFTIGDLRFHAYPVMLAIAFIAGTLLTVRQAEKRGIWLPPAVGIWIFVGALFGAKVFWILQYDPEWPKHIWRAIMIWNAGLVFYGGLIGGTVAAYAYTKFFRIPQVRALDCMVPYLAMGQAITRLGCFLNGCCYGAPTSVPWAVEYPPNSHAFVRQVEEGLLPPDAAHSLAVHPAPLYMIAGHIVIFVILTFALARQRFRGQVVFLYALLYGILRGVVEGLRGDSARSIFHTLTVSQTISVAFVIIGGGMLLYAWLRGWFKLPLLGPEDHIDKLIAAEREKEARGQEKNEESGTSDGD